MALNTIQDLKNRRNQVVKFSRHHSISPYGFLLLALSNKVETIEEIELVLVQSGIAKEGLVYWYNQSGDDKTFNFDAMKYTIRKLKQDGFFELDGRRGRSSVTKIIPSPTGTEIIKLWMDFVVTFSENAEKELTEQKKLANNLEIDIHKDVFKFDIDTLPYDLQTTLSSDAETSYIKLCQSLIQKFEPDEHTDKIRIMPVFFNIPSTLKKISHSADYFKGGLTLISGWVTGFSKTKELRIGKVYRCTENTEHVLLTNDKHEFCPYCSNDIKIETHVDLPVYEIHIDTSTGEKITAYVHADLWRPGSVQSDEQKILLFKLKSAFVKHKDAQDIKYMVIGLEEEDEFRVDIKKAEALAKKSTAEILSVIDNSLFQDLAGLKPIKDLAIITLASMNTKEMIVPVRGRPMAKRGILNALFYGVPGTGKTEIPKRLVTLVANRLAKGQADNTSQAGWTAAYDSKEKYVRAGLIPLNNTRAVLIDELDKFEKVGFLLQPLEEKIIDWSKGGLSVSYDAYTVMFMTANNKKPIGEDPLEQIKQEIEQRGRNHTPIIDRTDIICLLSEAVSSKDILANWLGTDSTEIYEHDEIKNYFEALRLIEQVSIDKETLKKLSDTLTKEDLRLFSRSMLSFMRVACAIAKLHLRSEVNETDLKEATHYYLEMLKTLNKYNPRIVIEEIGKPSKLIGHVDMITETIRHTPKEESQLMFEFPELDVVGIISTLRKQGVIFMNPKGRYELI